VAAGPLRLAITPADVRTGGRVALGVGGAPGRGTVRFEADPWPFDGVWTPAGEATATAYGDAALSVRPDRNTRYRALSGEAATAPRTAYAELAVTVDRQRVAGGRFREIVTMTGPADAALASRTMHFYVPAGRRTLRRARSAAIRTLAPGRFRASAVLRGRRVLFCYREPSPDAFGRPVAGDDDCGARRLRVTG
ncbi:MAG: hypothetical protein HZB46_02510, partial [Solirubrobacterales bacterium]|nr:hypothetical protein [Solirubrobacterales bacterium]